jgi:hypothetical protein
LAAAFGRGLTGILLYERMPDWLNKQKYTRRQPTGSRRPAAEIRISPEGISA